MQGKLFYLIVTNVKKMLQQGLNRIILTVCPKVAEGARGGRNQTNGNASDTTKGV